MGFVKSLITGPPKPEKADLISDPLNLDNLQQFGDRSLDAVNMLRGEAQGKGVAQQVLNNATANNIAQQAAFAASQKGVNPALAARLASQQGANLNQQAAAQAAQNQLAAAQAYSQAAQGGTQIYGNELAQLNSANAGQTASINQANQSAYQSNMGIVGGIGSALTAGLLKKGDSDDDAKKKAFGGKVEGKAKVKGDSYENDTEPHMLSPGEIVIPRSAASSPEKAKAFIDALMKSKEQNEPEGYSKVLKSHKKLEERLKRLEKKSKE